MKVMESVMNSVVCPYLSPEDLLGLSRANKLLNNIAAMYAADQYAHCVAADQPVPNNVRQVLIECRERIKSRIVSSIAEKGIFHRFNPLPGTLSQFFTPAARDLIDAIMFSKPRGFFNSAKPELMNSALLHMGTCGTFYEDADSAESAALTCFNPQFAEKARSYVTLTDALSMPADMTVPHHIIATYAELTTHGDEITAFFAGNPTHELVVDFGADAAVPCFFRIPNSVTRLSLVGENLTSIGEYFHFNNGALTSLTLPEGLRAIGDYFLNYNDALTSLTLPKSLEVIGNFFLSNNKALTSLILPKSLEVIGNYFLHNNEALTSLTLPESLRVIGNFFLRYNKALTRLTLPKSLEMIGDRFLSSNRLHTRVTLSGGTALYAARLRAWLLTKR